MGGGRFPETRRSAVLALGSDLAEERSRAYGILVSSYWKPIYKYLRLKWRESDEDARDSTQGFFAIAFEKGYFAKYDPDRGLFRTYLRTCLDGYVANQRKAAKRIKRGGSVQLLSLDFQEAEGEIRRCQVPDEASMDDFFQQEWARSVFSLSVEDLRQDCFSKGQQVHFQIFQRYDLESPAAGERATYADLAAEFGIASTDVTNYLASVRRRFRRFVLDKLRDLTASEREFRQEARALLGIEVR